MWWISTPQNRGVDRGSAYFGVDSIFIVLTSFISRPTTLRMALGTAEPTTPRLTHAYSTEAQGGGIRIG